MKATNRNYLVEHLSGIDGEAEGALCWYGNIVVLKSDGGTGRVANVLPGDSDEIRWILSRRVYL